MRRTKERAIRLVATAGVVLFFACGAHAGSESVTKQEPSGYETTLTMSGTGAVLKVDETLYGMPGALYEFSVTSTAEFQYQNFDYWPTNALLESALSVTASFTDEIQGDDNVVFDVGVPTVEWVSVDGLRKTVPGDFAAEPDPHADGRVFVDTQETWGGGDLESGHFDAQRILLTVSVDLGGLTSSTCRVRWAVYDPDDPATNEWADVNGEQGGDNTGQAHEGGTCGLAASTNSILARGGEVPSPDVATDVLLETADTDLSVHESGAMTSSVLLYLSDDAGDNFRVRAYLVVDGAVMGGDCSGLWTMWRKRTLVVDAMETVDGLGIHYPADEESLEHVQEILHDAFANANPEHACYLDIVAAGGETDMTAAGSLDAYSTNAPTAYQWNNYLREELHAASSAHAPAIFHGIGANYLVDNSPTNFIGGTARNAPDAGVARGFLTTDAVMIALGVSVSKALVHEIGHLTGRDASAMHYDHSDGVPASQCAFGMIANGSCILLPRPLCERHCRDVRSRIARSWTLHESDELSRDRTFDSSQ